MTLDSLIGQVESPCFRPFSSPHPGCLRWSLKDSQAECHHADASVVVQRRTIFPRFLPTSDTVVELQKEDIMFSIPSVAQGLCLMPKI